MESALLLLSAISGLVAAFVASAVWATRPQPLSPELLASRKATQRARRR